MGGGGGGEREGQSGLCAMHSVRKKDIKLCLRQDCKLEGPFGMLIYASINAFATAMAVMWILQAEFIYLLSFPWEYCH